MSLITLAQLAKRAIKTDREIAKEVSQLRQKGRFWQAACLDDKNYLRERLLIPGWLKVINKLLETPCDIAEGEGWSRLVYINNKLILANDQQLSHRIQVNHFVNTCNQALKAYLLFTPFAQPKTEDQELGMRMVELSIMHSYAKISAYLGLANPSTMDNSLLADNLLPFPGKLINWGSPCLLSLRNLIIMLESSTSEKGSDMELEEALISAKKNFASGLACFSQFVEIESRVVTWTKNAKVFSDGFPRPEYLIRLDTMYDSIQFC